MKKKLTYSQLGIEGLGLLDNEYHRAGFPPFSLQSLDPLPLEELCGRVWRLILSPSIRPYRFWGYLKKDLKKGNPRQIQGKDLRWRVPDY
jgi:hypothetical protein